MADEQLRFGPPLLTAVSITVLRRPDGWEVVVRSCRQGAGWSPQEQTTYEALTANEATDVGYEELVRRLLHRV